MQPAASIQVHGHRGARAVMPENTLPAFRYAISVGADFLEMDVAVTRDDVPVISHDPVLRSGETIRQLALAELRRIDPTVPALDEVLALDGAGFNIEMKSYPQEPRFTPPPDRCAALLLYAIHGRAVGARVIVQSFDFRILRETRRLAPRIRLAALVETDTPDFVAATRAAGADIMAPQFPLVTAEKVAAARAAGIPVVPWTVNTPADWSRVVEAGVDGIISDDPAALITWLKARGLR
jgi:glycerophosphoryl diester phosphodiesterase